MTDNQFNQLFDSLTTVLESIESIEEAGKMKSSDSESKSDVNELKQWQNRIEKPIRLNNAAFNELAGEQLGINSRITELEKASV